MLTTAPRHCIDLQTLLIDKANFVAHDSVGVALPVKMKFMYDCDQCQQPYAASLEFERVKKYPWCCKSCAISREWAEPDYRTKHVLELTKVNGTPEARQRRSVQSKLNWADPNVKQRMLANRDRKSASKKGQATRVTNLLTGVSTYKVPHGKRTLVGSTWMRSTYEARFAEALNTRNIAWVYEPRWFDVGNQQAYLPDFYIPAFNVYVEVKGYWRDDAKLKFDAFVSLYPDIRYVLVMKSELELIEKKETSLETYIVEARR